ncbi:MAG: acyl-CoA thioesterase [Myxococcales bacterium]|nr:acyl-CoA thioesterase [Myxococcales bacterium]
MTERDRPEPPERAQRAEFAYVLPIPTRWMDNDVYGHVNNVVYYSYFDTAVNEHLVRAGVLDIHRSPAIGVVVETRCRFHHELSFPETIDAGLAVRRLGRSSVVYRIGLFRQGHEDAAATGHFVHVYVDRQARTPVPVPPDVRRALAPLLLDPPPTQSPPTPISPAGEEA